MNPAALPVQTNLRERIFAAVVAGFRTILTTNNYETNLGDHVFPWQDHALSDVQLPAAVIRDTGLSPVDGSVGQCVQYRMHFEVALVTNHGTDSPSLARKLWADVVNMLRLNRKWRDGADQLNVTTEFVGDEMRVREKDETFAGVFLKFFVLFKMQGLDPYTPSP